MISPLADLRLRRLFAAQAVALIGTGMASVALALLAYDLAGGTAAASLNRNPAISTELNCGSRLWVEFNRHGTGWSRFSVPDTVGATSI